MLRFDRKQQNFVKQLPFNLKINKFEKSKVPEVPLSKVYHFLNEEELVTYVRNTLSTLSIQVNIPVYKCFSSDLGYTQFQPSKK